MAKYIFVQKAQSEKGDVIGYSINEDIGFSEEQFFKMRQQENTLFLGKYSDFLKMADVVLKSELAKKNKLIEEMLQLNLSDL